MVFTANDGLDSSRNGEKKKTHLPDDRRGLSPLFARKSTMESFFISSRSVILFSAKVHAWNGENKFFDML